MIYAASLDCADQMHLADDVSCLMEAGLPVLHMDIMDGNFVPNLSMNFQQINGIHTLFPAAQMDVHLMTTDPFAYLDRLQAAGAWCVTSHLSPLAGRIPEFLEAVRARGMRCGLALSPDEPAEAILPYARELDLVLVMSVKPGFAGQTFMPMAYDKLRALAGIRQAAGAKYLLSVDGGINYGNSKQCRDAGADMLIMGVFTFFRQPVPLSEACKKYMDFMEE